MANSPHRIIYNADTHTVTFKSSHSEWKLNDLLGQGKIQRFQLRQQLYAWARGKRSGARKRKENAALGKAGVYVRRLREAIAKLGTPARQNLSARSPASLPARKWAEAGNYSRDVARRWADEKPIRKAIAKVAGRKTVLHGEPQTWADFYRAVGSATARRVSESETFSRVHARKRLRYGLPDHPDREDYLKNLPRYLFMAEKSYDSRPYDPFKKDTYGEQLNAFEQHHPPARQEYCAALRERDEQ